MEENRESFWTEKFQIIYTDAVPSSIYKPPHHLHVGCRKEVPSAEHNKERQEKSNFILEKLPNQMTKVSINLVSHVDNRCVHLV